MIIKILLALVVFVPPALAQGLVIENGWKGIRVFKTQRAEIEKMFGNPTFNSGALKVYDLPEGKLVVTYSNGRCDKIPSTMGIYDVDENTIDEYRVNFSKAIPLSRLKWKKKRFEVVRTTHRPEVYDYVDSENGIWITAFLDNNVEMASSLLFLGSKDMRKTLSCDKLKPSR